MTLLVRDEEDILDAHLRYHFAAGVDYVIAMDNLSTDGTPEILRAYEREGRLRRLEEHGGNYDQDIWVTRMARLAAGEHGADWVINSDADEFWWPESEDLKAVLGEMPRSQIAASVTPTNFVPRPPTREPFFRSLTVRERVSFMPGTTRPVLDKVCHRARRDIEVNQGNHAVFRRRVFRHQIFRHQLFRHELRPRRLFRRQSLPAVPVPITLLHFPIRSYSQFANKIANMGAAYDCSPRLSLDVFRPLGMLYDLLLRGELESYYESLVKDDAAVAKGLREGTLIRDNRLRLTLDALYGGRPS